MKINKKLKRKKEKKKEEDGEMSLSSVIGASALSSRFHIALGG